MYSKFNKSLAFSVLSGFFFLYIYICVGCGNNTFKNGQVLYNNKCANCHQENGSGLESLYPPLKNSDYWQTNQEEIPCIIRHGLSDTILVNGNEFKMPMLPISDLSEPEIANIINYINKEWYNESKFYTPKEVKVALKKCE